MSALMDRPMTSETRVVWYLIQQNATPTAAKKAAPFRERPDARMSVYAAGAGGVVAGVPVTTAAASAASFAAS